MESLVLLICLKTTQPACESAATAYYTQSGAEAVIAHKTSYYAQKNPRLAAIVGYAAAVSQNSIAINLGMSKFLTIDAKQRMIGYKFGF